jgi:hypothetical protein
MRQFYLILALSFTILEGYSNKVDGYIVTLNNDTEHVQVKAPGIFHYKQIKVEDSIGTTKVFTPNDIKAYGYTYKSKHYVFRSKPIKDGSYYFLEVVKTGNKTSLYSYVWDDGKKSEEIYTFEKSDGTYLFLEDWDSLKKFRTALKSFYSNNLEVQQLIDNKFLERREIRNDIQDIVAAVNNS